MFYMNIRHNVKKDSSSKNTFHYLTRTAHFAEQKADEELEFVRSGNMPSWAVDAPASFWHSADRYEIARGRTSSTLTVALPKELSKQQRKELVEAFIQEFADQYQFPYTAAVHNHPSELTGEDQPHLHLMYSERSLADGIERPPEQFFKQYRPKNPTKGGAQKLTADALGFGRDQVKAFREKTEQLINQALERHAPMKTVILEGMEIVVPNRVSHLSNQEFNQKYGTQLQDVPQIHRWKLKSADPMIQLEVEAQKHTIQQIRQFNKLQIYQKEYNQALEQRKNQDLDRDDGYTPSWF